MLHHEETPLDYTREKKMRKEWQRLKEKDAIVQNLEGYVLIILLFFLSLIFLFQRGDYFFIKK